MNPPVRFCTAALLAIWTAGAFAQAFPARPLRIVVAFPPRPARFVRLRAASGGNDAPWVIAELEVWSSSTESR